MVDSSIECSRKNDMGWILLLILVALVIVASVPAVRCTSHSCLHNKNGICINRKKMFIYDNGVLGICLWHTSNMDDRVLQPYLNGLIVGEKTGEIKMLDILLKEVGENQALIDDPKKFERWITNKMKGKER